MKTALKWTGFVLFFLFFLLFVVYVTFPTDRLARVGEVKLAELLNADRVEIEGLSLSGLGGLTADTVTIELPPLKVPTAVPGGWEWGPKRLLLLEDVDFSAGLGDIIGLATGGGVEAEISTRLQGGQVSSAKVVYAPEQGMVTVAMPELTNVTIGPEGALQALTGFDVAGRLSGSLDVRLPLEGRRVRIDRMQARADLVMRDATLRKPQFDHPSLGRVVLSDADLGEVTIKIDVDEAKNLASFAKRLRGARADHTVIHAAEVKINGPDLEIELSDESAITLVPDRPMKEAAVNIHMGVRITDAFIDKSVPDPNNPGQMTQPNQMIRFAMQQNPIKPVLQNGAFGLAITGRLGKPQVRFERPRGVSGFVSRKVNLDGAGDAPEPADDGLDEPIEDDEPMEDDEPEASDMQPRARPEATRRIPATTAQPDRAQPQPMKPTFDRGAVRRPNLLPQPQPALRTDGGIPGIPHAPDPEPEPIDEELPYEEPHVEEPVPGEPLPYEEGEGELPPDEGEAGPYEDEGIY